MKAILNICISNEEANNYIEQVKEVTGKEPTIEEFNSAFINYFLEHSNEHLFMENIHINII